MLAVLFCFVFTITYGLSYIKTCNVTDYGAVGDGKTDNTKSIQSAIVDCAKASTPKDMSLVLLPLLNNKETIYLSGALFFESNIAFKIEKDVRLLGIPATTNSLNESYPYIYTRYAGTMSMTHSSLLNGGLCLNINTTNYNSSYIGDQCTKWNKLSNIKIFGYGTIDGNGDSGWYNTTDTLRNTRPCLLNLMWINNLIIFNVTIVNPPFWTLHPIFSNDIFIENVSIVTDSPNGDGIDPDSCSNVMISNSYISTGDDQIAIKSGKDADGRAVGIPTNNVSVINMRMGNGNGLSIGSEMSGNVTNILFENITVNTGTMKQGPHIKSSNERGGIVENVTYKNIFIKNVAKTGISIDEYYGSSDGTYYPIFKNISLVNVTIMVEKSGVDGVFKCYQEQPCTDILLDNVHVSGGSSFQCKDAYGTAIDTEPKSCLKSERNIYNEGEAHSFMNINKVITVQTNDNSHFIPGSFC